MNIKQATAGLRTLFHTIVDTTIHEIYDKDKARYVAPIPDGTGNQLVIEGTSWRKGEWQLYLQTPVAGGRRIIQDIDLKCPARNDNIISLMDAYIEERVAKGHNGMDVALDNAYTGHIRIPMQKTLDKTMG